MFENDLNVSYTQHYLFEKIVVPAFKLYPEMVVFTGQTAATSEGVTSTGLDSNSWTYLLTQAGLLSNTFQRHIELERTLQSIVCLHLLYDGSEAAYSYWIQSQNVAVLTEDSFRYMHDLCKKYANIPDFFQAMEASLVYSDLGKSRNIRDLSIEVGIESDDHDDLMQAVYAASPRIRNAIIPSFERLPKDVKKYIVDLHLAAPIHWGYLLQLEGGCKMLEPLLYSKKLTTDMLIHNFLINICDIAGALAHVEPLGSKTFNQNAWLGFNMVFDTIQQLLVHRVPSKAYSDLVQKKAKCLGLATADSALTEQTFILTRLGFFLRFYHPKEGRLLREYADKLWSETEWFLGIQVFGNNSGLNTWRRHPTYMPAVLLNLFNSGSIESDKYTRALQGLMVLAKIVNECDKLGYGELEQPINFNNLAAQAKINPYLFQQQLDSIEINWDDLQNITIKNPKRYPFCSWKK